MLCVRCFLNASFYAKAQNSDASFRIWRKSGFADYTEKQKRPAPCQPCMPKPHEKEKKKRAGPWMRTGIIHLNYG